MRCWGNHNSLKKEGLKLKRNLPENFQLSVKGMSVQADGNQEEKIHVNSYAGQVPLYQATEDIVAI